ncbi:sigma-54-dependent Fis family transcriptional regulator [Azoarcus sp. DD4]|uniref:sigma-54-dependent Fis family transcriptional regulator n=1 Tax=Azoarcus sp. DD4 TaxID=2027405 RepID=UPI00143D20B6|nr:sigma-54-dependent Fis family transcriptional regulator [Azoarcus sp. DD4]
MSNAREYARPTTVEAIRKAVWDGKECPSGTVADVVLRSWTRCRTEGVAPTARQEFDAVPRTALGESLEVKRTLVLAAEPVVDALMEQLNDAPRMIILNDERGVVLLNQGNDSLLADARKRAVRAGVCWDERTRGTNAMGTALAERRPVAIHGAEHYLEANSIFTCTAAPIYDPFGELTGVLDISGYAGAMGPVPVPFVQMAVQLIENQLFRQTFADCILLRFHLRPDFVGTLREGIAVLSREGTIVSMNRTGLKIAGLGLEAVADHRFDSVFDMNFGAFLDHVKESAFNLVRLSLYGGAQVYARVEPGLRAPPRPAARVRPPRPAPRPLDSLDTGDAAVQLAIDRARRGIARNLSILIQGETGAGKEVFAKHLHAESPRSKGPFVAVNCAAIPEGLIESELFGYEEGAFTGGRRKGNIGKIAQAHGGTLFLDEIGDMALGLQTRLLRVLQDRMVVPLGGREPQPVDIALVCATHRDLRGLIARGQFREDLYYRLNGLAISLPPLRDRSDLAVLVNHVLTQCCGGESHYSVSPEVMALFRRHAWPGNLRQLHNVLDAALAMLDEGHVIETHHLPEDFVVEVASHVQSIKEEVSTAAHSSRLPAPRCNPVEKLHNLELDAIHRAIEENHGNISAAARQLGISRITIYRKLRQFSLTGRLPPPLG